MISVPARHAEMDRPAALPGGFFVARKGMFRRRDADVLALDGYRAQRTLDVVGAELGLCRKLSSEICSLLSSQIIKGSGPNLGKSLA